MRSDFINKREPLDRRNLRFLSGSSGGSGDSKFIIVNKSLFTNFDTFMFHNPFGYSGGDRWNFIPNADSPSSAQSIPIGFINPWNDGANIQFTSTEQSVAPRTPTRAVLSFNISEIPQNSTIVSASLNIGVESVNQLNESRYLQEFLFTDGTSKGNWSEQALSEGGTLYLPIKFGVFEYGSGGVTSSVYPMTTENGRIPLPSRVWLRNDREYTISGDLSNQRLDQHDFIFSWTGKLVEPYVEDHRIEIGFMRSHGGDFTVDGLAGSGLERMVGFINYPGQTTWRASVWKRPFDENTIPKNHTYEETFSNQTSASLTQSVNLKVVVYGSGSIAKFYVNDVQVGQATGTGPNGQLPSQYLNSVGTDSGAPRVFSGFNHRDTAATQQKRSISTTEMWCRKMDIGSLSNASIVAAEKQGGWLPTSFTS